MGLPLWFTDSLLALQGLQVQSLVRELRSHMPQGTAKQTKTKKATKESLRRSIEVQQVDKREKGALGRGTCVGRGTLDGKRKLSLRSSE